jgi:hypothetical protein
MPAAEETKAVLVGFIDDEGEFRHAVCAERAGKVSRAPILSTDNLSPISDRSDPENLKPCAECGRLATEAAR